MRYKEIITELTGIKKHTSRDLTFSGAKEYLQSLGFEALGSGQRGHVFLDPTDNSKVFKVYTDSSYDHFIEFCKAHPENPCLPRFKGNPILLKRDFSSDDKRRNAKMIRMEKLKPMDTDTIQKIDQLASTAYTLLKGNWKGRAKREFDKRLKEWKKTASPMDLNLLQTFCELIEFSGRENYYDMHDENVMMRGDQPVITDPYS